jgi:hypothetical protein
MPQVIQSNSDNRANSAARDGMASTDRPASATSPSVNPSILSSPGLIFQDYSNLPGLSQRFLT